MMGNDKVPAIDSAKSMSLIDSMARWENWAAIAAALSSAANENHGDEFGVHGDIDIFCLGEILTYDFSSGSSLWLVHTQSGSHRYRLAGQMDQPLTIY